MVRSWNLAGVLVAFAVAFGVAACGGGDDGAGVKTRLATGEMNDVCVCPRLCRGSRPARPVAAVRSRRSAAPRARRRCSPGPAARRSRCPRSPRSQHVPGCPLAAAAQRVGAAGCAIGRPAPRVEVFAGAQAGPRVAGRRVAATRTRGVRSIGPVRDQLHRRFIGSRDARSVLLTVLGEYVLPSHEAVWQETLVGSLEALDHKTQSARQALARSVAGGWLTRERHGRRARLSLTPTTAEILSAGAERIYSFGEDWSWEGEWLLVVLRVPEHRRDLRNRMRTRLEWAGFGSIGGGVWITPHADRESEIRLPRDADGAIELLTFGARLASFGDPRAVVAGAWDLERRRGGVRRLRARVRPAAAEDARGGVPRADDARARVAEVPVPRSRPAGRPAAGPLAASASARTVPRASRRVGPRGAGLLPLTRRAAARRVVGRPARGGPPGDQGVVVASVNTTDLL